MIIILTGVHILSSGFSDVESYKQNTVNNKNKNIEVNIDDPNNHLCIFVNVKNY